LAEVATRRLKEVGYTVVTDPAQPHDILFRVKCEQRKIWEGTSASGGDADLPDSPSRVWKGPACQLTYLLDGKKMGWRKEVRTDFLDAVQAAAEAKAGDPGAYALAKLKDRLEQYDFPVLVTAEWGQEDRLFKILDDPSTAQTRKVKIISLFGEIFADKAVTRLLTALKDPDIEIAKAAAVALGNIGQKESIPALIEALKTGRSDLRAEAAKGLGLVGAMHGD
ncbi:MAG: HEAT repeat domain-containing protein, partial [Nitrospirota bacterium]